jgi:hypothetical protein
MKELFGLKSFQQILLLLFFLGFTIGVLYGIYLFSPDKFRYYSIITALPALFFILRGLYKNIPFLINDFKSIYVKL